MELNYTNNFYYPKSASPVFCKQNFIVNRLKSYEIVKKRIGKVYSYKVLNRNLETIPKRKVNSYIQTYGKTISIANKTKSKSKSVGTFAGKYDLAISFADYSKSSLHPKSPVSGWTLKDA